ncbi:hypothetical protein [Deinococcus humi]|uniref:Uncharacterized protein n=1 Tax=Deinococcus humi TaxID=662880 RepID=A0A7W8JUY9_9DEIO|nr:hypothetical protein [Deinococcus humi]MBB5363666.1 hypothetical protein [Deinococcus humi]GGO29855.1 hypothetical protein GCM10008949_23920 [Deinococcus humi]
MNPISEATRIRLTSSLGLPEAPADWDWYVSVADAQRVKEFLAVYEAQSWSGHERSALMELILISYDFHLGEHGDGDQQLKTALHRTLVRDFALHRQSLEDWCHFDEPQSTAQDKTRPFDLGALAKRVWSEVMGSESRQPT